MDTTTTPATNLLLTTDTQIPMTLPLATGAVQRFPESCQRSSLADTPEDEPDTYHPPYAAEREASPSSRFYSVCRSRRASESSEASSSSSSSASSSDSGYSSYSGCGGYTSYSQPPLDSSHMQQPHSEALLYASGPSRRSTSSTLDSMCEALPALSDCDSMSSASSEGPMSPEGPWYSGHATSVEPPELPLQQAALRSSEARERRSTSPAVRVRSSSSVSEFGAGEFQESGVPEVDLDKHSTFSKVVVTKFSNPPRYRLKKVKFHQCPICQKSFPRPSGLRTHMNMHTNTKPYTCPYPSCTKSFSVISNAKRHYRTHLVDVPPEQMGLPSGPYEVNFSEPVVIPDSSISSSLGSSGSTSSLNSFQEYDERQRGWGSPATSTSSLSTSSSSSSLSSLSSLKSLSSRSEEECADIPSACGPQRRARSRSRSASSAGVGGEESGRGRTLRWLPMGADSRAPWKASAAVSARVRC